MISFSCFLMVLILLSTCGCEDSFDCSDSEESSEEKAIYCNKQRSSEEEDRESIEQSKSIEEICNASNTVYSCSGSDELFVCRSEGRYPDVSDPTYRTYFQCDKLKDGTFSKKILKCSSSPFCPSTQKCSSLFVCPCTSAKSSTSNITKSETVTTVPAVNTTLKESTISYICSISSKEGEEFNCTTWGRFPDLTDRSCQRYFLCSILQNGSFIKTEYTCLKSVFDPDTKRCSKQYVCPCTSPPTTQSSTSRTEPVITTSERPVTTPTTTATTGGSRASTTVSEKHTTASIATTTSNEIITTSTTTTISYTCSGSSNEVDEFKCTVWGRFPDLADSSCQRYFLCSYLQNGSFVKTEYTCLNSVFDPDTKRCSKQYMCPCSVSSSTSSSVSSTTSAVTTSEGSTNIPTVTTAGSTSVLTTTSTDRSTKITEPEEPTTKPAVFTTTTTVNTTESEKPSTAASVTTTSTEFTTTPVATTISYTCASSSEEVDEFNCTVWGRFPDLTDSTCQRYFLCSYLQNGSFVKTEYTCLNSVFDPDTKRCSKQYMCPCSVSSSTSSSVSSTTSAVTTSEGSTNIPTVTTAGSTSVLTTTSTDRSTKITEPEEPTTKPAVFTTTTTVNTTESEKPSTAASVTTTSTEFTTTPVATTISYTCASSSEEVDEFNCTVWGRFPDLTDSTCQRYFLCSYLQNGSFVKTEYTCLNSVFDPDTKRCSKQYMCPCSVSSSTSSSVSSTTSAVTTSEGSTNIPTVTTAGSTSVLTTTSTDRSTKITEPEEPTTKPAVFTTTTTVNTTESEKPSTAASVTTTSTEFTTTPVATTISYTCASSSEEVDEFNCTVWGRFPDLTDSTCQRYFLCSYLQNGSFVKTEYTCLNSVFDPDTKRCSKQYMCPCSVSSSTSSSVSSTTSAVTTSEGSTNIPTVTTAGSTSVLTTTSTDRSTKITEPEEPTTKPAVFTTTTTVNTTESEKPSTAASVTTTSTEFTTTPVATTISYTCASSSEEVDEFNCTVWGRFPDLTDSTCQRYFLCSYLQNGSFVKTEYTCLNSVFDPDTKRCSKQYMCPCSVSSSTSSSVSSTTSAVTTSEGSTNIPTVTTAGSTSVLTTTSTDRSTKITEPEEPTTKPAVFTTTTTVNTTESEKPSTAASVTTTSTEFTTTPVATTISYTCASSSEEVDEFNCTVWGRFPDLTDSTCQRYFLCSYLQNGSFVKTEYTCLNSVFDPDTKRCSKQYMCPCSVSSSTSSSVSSTTSAVTTSEGSTNIPTVTTAGSTSVLTTTSTDRSTKITEPEEPTTKPAVFTTTTTVNTTESEKPSTAASVTTTSTEFTTTPVATTISYTCASSSEEVDEFNCTVWGRFPDLTDSTCQRYFLCSYLQNGSFVKTEYTCLNSVFDPETKRCSKQYMCPCSASSSTSFSEKLPTVPAVTITAEGSTTVAITREPGKQTSNKHTNNNFRFPFYG